jgi:hypothetical protein
MKDIFGRVTIAPVSVTHRMQLTFSLCAKEPTGVKRTPPSITTLLRGGKISRRDAVTSVIFWFWMRIALAMLRMGHPCIHI